MELTNLSVIRDLCERYGFEFSKTLGQNFLTNAAIPVKIAEGADIDNKFVLEVGPGFGCLTKELCKRAKKVVAVELDKSLLPVLDETLGEFFNLDIINDDILNVDISALCEKYGVESVDVCANLPYYITTPIITKLIEEKLNIKNIVVMVQKEVACRMQAKPSTKDYGAITLLCRYYAEPSIVTNVPASLFVPPPKVDSAVLKLDMLDEPRVKVLDEKMFFRVVKAAFSQRRKTLLNCLSSAFPISKDELSGIMESSGITPSRRGETLDIDEFAKLSDSIYEFLNSKK